MNRKERRANRRQDSRARDGSTHTGGSAELVALAATHQAHGRHREAVKLFKQVLAGQPAHATAHDGLATAYQALGRRDDAVRHFGEAISFGLLGAETLVKQSPAVMATLSRFGPFAQPLQLADLGGAAAVADDALLLALLQSRIVCDVELERFLTAARRVLLAAVAESELPDSLLDFGCALAQQCFLNEFVFALSDAETSLVTTLEGRVAEAARAGVPIAPGDLAVLACYRPLHRVRDAEKLAARRWPKPIDDMLTRQLREPLAEAAEAAAVPALTAVDDEISRKVQSQYEESPYPRWSVALPVQATTLADDMRERFGLAAFPGGDILVAGCGTGEHSIETARRFPQSKVLAIDISRASLAYARRKTRKLGIGNVEYAQADILRLGSLGRQFDLIESVGVLHHLFDPEAGWRVLLSLLRPGGVMRIGLYSELGRRPLATGRALIAERGYRPTADGLRAWRQELIQRGQVIGSSDFFSISGCRDLCFHVMEHRFTLPRIKQFLNGNGLTVLGLETSAETQQQFLQEHPVPGAQTDLDRWDAFERAHPRTFVGMYYLWLRKN